MHPVRVLPLLAAAAICAAMPARADDRQADLDFARRMFAGNVPDPKAYACFTRRYDAAHLAQHPLQKVSVMRLLITSEKDSDVPVLEYSFRLGVNFRDRAGDFDSSGGCGHAPALKGADTSDVPAEDRMIRPAGIDFACNVDCDGGGIAISLADNDRSVILRLDHIRIWKGTDADDAAIRSLEGGADDKIFRLDRSSLNECAALVTDRKELAAVRHK
jgi:hypothetical protein